MPIVKADGKAGSKELGLFHISVRQVFSVDTYKLSTERLPPSSYLYLKSP